MTDTADQTLFAEIYLQISTNILASFPKFRPPVDLFVADPGTGQVKLLHRAGERLSPCRRDEVLAHAANERLFFVRTDYRVYARHLSRRLGLLLDEHCFTPVEVAEIVFLALRDRMEIFLDRSQPSTYENLWLDVTILVEYLLTNPDQIDFLTLSLSRENKLSVHSVNTMLVGLSLYLRLYHDELDREELTSMALALLLHDLGMARVPGFVTGKKVLKHNERKSVEHHLLVGLGMLERLDIDDPVIRECVLRHHERINGRGYPDRLKGDSLGLAARICGLADSFSAMISLRSYSGPCDLRDAALQLSRETDRYDPVLVRLLIEAMASGSVGTC